MPLPPRRQPSVPDRVEILERDERDRDAEHRRHRDELAHAHNSALSSATNIWREIAAEVQVKLTAVETKLDTVIISQRGSELERLARTENDAAKDATHRRRVAYAKVLTPFVLGLLTLIAGAIASQTMPQTPPTAPAIRH